MYTALTPAQRLAMTLRFLAAGDSQGTLEFHLSVYSEYCLMHSETTGALVAALNPLYVKSPLCEDKWRNLARGFWRNWQFPHCIGAIYGKLIHIQAPQASGSVFFNYKKYFSVVLVVVYDADYNFTVVDIGADGSQSDGGIFNSSELGKSLRRNCLKVSPKSYLPGTDIDMAYFLVGDATFPMNKFLMKPYSGHNISHQEAVLNYRLGRARRVILVARWRIFRQPIIASLENVEKIIECAVCLHNFIRKQLSGSCILNIVPHSLLTLLHTGEIVEGEWHDIVAGENGVIIAVPHLDARNAAMQVVE